MQSKVKITIKDVAREADCGVATVSRVLNKSGSTSIKTRERVEKAARDLGFSFSATGRALQSSRSMTVGCLVPSLSNPVFAEAVQGIQEELLGANYQLLISSSNYNTERDNELLNILLSTDVDGLIVTMGAPAQSEALKMARARGVAISLMFHDPIDGFCTSYVDNTEAAREVARQFIAQNHKRTGFLALRFSESDRSRNRYSGFLSECRAHGLPDPVLIELSESEANTPEKLAVILKKHTDLTAIFASNDFLAIAIQKAARLLNWRVPQDISVAGFDGIEIGRLLEAPLATIETDPEAMGRQAAHSLLSALQGEEQQQLPSLPFTFRTGATLAAPSSERLDDDWAATQPPSVHPTSEKPK